MRYLIKAKMQMQLFYDFTEANVTKSCAAFASCRFQPRIADRNKAPLSNAAKTLQAKSGKRNQLRLILELLLLHNPTRQGIGFYPRLLNDRLLTNYLLNEKDMNH